MMPKTKLQDFIFTLMMAFVMVYAMVCYNIAMDMGGMTNQVFLLAFHEIQRGRNFLVHLLLLSVL